MPPLALGAAVLGLTQPLTSNPSPVSRHEDVLQAGRHDREAEHRHLGRHQRRYHAGPARRCPAAAVTGDTRRTGPRADIGQAEGAERGHCGLGGTGCGGLAAVRTVALDDRSSVSGA